jgi:putative phosphoesterase
MQMGLLAILADIHGNLPALQAVVADVARRGIPTVVNLGDHASGPLWPAETLTFLMAQPWVHIAGNHDRQLVAQPPGSHGASDRYAFERLTAAHRSWLAALPPTIRLESDVLLVHGTPTHDERYLLETVAREQVHLAQPSTIRERLAQAQAAVVLCGHSHTPRVVQLDAGPLIVNPGSVGLPAYMDDTPEPHRVETGAPHARYAVLQQHGQAWHVDLVAVPYDYARAAQQAGKNGREDWAVALRTGKLGR